MKKFVTWSGAVISLGIMTGGILYAEDRFNQSADIANVSDTVAVNTYQTHQFHFDDISDRVVLLDGILDRDNNQERELIMYKSRQERLRIKLERLSK